jgi:hypothetical protein
MESPGKRLPRRPCRSASRVSGICVFDPSGHGAPRAHIVQAEAIERDDGGGKVPARCCNERLPSRSWPSALTAISPADHVRDESAVRLAPGDNQDSSASLVLWGRSAASNPDELCWPGRGAALLQVPGDRELGQPHLGTQRREVPGAGGPNCGSALFWSATTYDPRAIPALSLRCDVPAEGLHSPAPACQSGGGISQVLISLACSAQKR